MIQCRNTAIVIRGRFMFRHTVYVYRHVRRQTNNETPTDTENRMTKKNAPQDMESVVDDLV